MAAVLRSEERPELQEEDAVRLEDALNLLEHADRLVDMLEDRPREDHIERVIGRGNPVPLRLDKRERVSIGPLSRDSRRSLGPPERIGIGRSNIVAHNFRRPRLEQYAEVDDPITTTYVGDRCAFQLDVIRRDEVDDLLRGVVEVTQPRGGVSFARTSGCATACGYYRFALALRPASCHRKSRRAYHDRELAAVSLIVIEVSERVPAERDEVTICIPLHGAHEEFVECMSSVLAHTPTDAPIVVADDASPDDRSRRFLEELDQAANNGSRHLLHAQCQESRLRAYGE